MAAARWCWPALAAGALAAAAAPASAAEAARHCCDAPLAEAPPLLACAATPLDHITGVPFAALLAAPAPGEDLYRCGSEALPGNCSRRLEDTSSVRRCVGRQSCELNLTELGGLCPGATGLEVRVRWTCWCDGEGRCGPGEPARLPPLPLRAEGNAILDASGKRLRLHGVNWGGAHITGTPSGLDRAPLGELARLVRELGFNVVRLSWSVTGVLKNPRVEDRYLAANPSLLNRTSLEVLDAVVLALQHAGVLVWLDNHMLDLDWCCSRLDCNGAWFNARVPEEDWLDAWRWVAARYAGVPAVVGAGLRNEPRSSCGGRSWGGEGATCDARSLGALEAGGCAELGWAAGPLQWREAAARAGAAVLEANPRLLVSVGGLEYATDLREAAAWPVELPHGHLVYEAHEYSWSTYSRWAGKSLDGPIPELPEGLAEGQAKHLCDGLGPACGGVACARGAENCTVRAGASLREGRPGDIAWIRELQEDTPFGAYAAKLTRWWGYLLEQRVAPVFLSEFGFSHGFANTSEGRWLGKLSRYVQAEGPLGDGGGLDWAYWQLVGVQEGGTGRTAGATESFGVLNRCATGAASPGHMAAVRRLQDPANSGAPARLLTVI